MAKFKTDTAFYGSKEAKEFTTKEPFEMNIKRAEEVVANGKKKHGLDIKLTRLDAKEEQVIEVANEESKPELKKEQEDAPKEEPKKDAKKAGEDK